MTIREISAIQLGLKGVYTALVCFGLTTGGAQAQISAIATAHSAPTSYSDHDSLFYYSTLGTKVLRVVSGLEVAVDTEWFGYNVSTGSFDLPLKHEVAVSSELSATQMGGYRARLTLESGVKDFHCWLFEPKIDSAAIRISESGCFLLSLLGVAWADTLEYVHPQTHEALRRAQKLVPVWNTKPEVAWNDTSAWILSGLEPLYDSTAIELLVSNEAGHRISVTQVYEPEAVLAAFAYEQVNRDFPHEVDAPDKMSAPAVVRFRNDSKGQITAFEWSFGAAGKGFEPDPVYTFQQPGNYEVKLKVTNEKSGCEQETEPVVLTVTESYIAFPNVFSPNGDGVNDEFRPTFKSLKTYSIVIYNRWGRKVYASDQLAEGWDGTVGGRAADPGIYYYVAEASGFPKGDTHVRKGSVTLVR